METTGKPVKITKRKLREIILKETRHNRSSHRGSSRRSLASYLFEDIVDDVVTALEKGPAAAKKLGNEADPKELLKTLRGDFDEVEKDDRIEITSPTMVNVGGFKPTQKEIDLMKSAAFPLGDADTLEQAITSNTTGAPGSITVAGDEVIDGHHRWSGVWAISGPKGNISVEDVGLPGETKQKLATAQLAIASYKKPGQEMPAAGKPIKYNILGMPARGIYDMLLQNVNKQVDEKAPGPLLNHKMLKDASDNEVISKWAGFKIGADIGKVRNAIAKKVAKNLSTIPKNPAAPDRADMPQFDHKTIGGKKAKKTIYHRMKNADINLKPPFKAEAEAAEDENEANESTKSDEQLVMERWMKLSGLLKD